MSFHPLKAEPMVRSPYPAHPGFQSDLEPLMIVLAVPGMERADWDTWAQTSYGPAGICKSGLGTSRRERKFHAPDMCW